MVQLLQHPVHSHHVEGQGYIYEIAEPYHYHSGASYHSGANNHPGSNSGANYHAGSNSGSNYHSGSNSVCIYLSSSYDDHHRTKMGRCGRQCRV